jgi:hypothetical protein
MQLQNTSLRKYYLFLIVFLLRINYFYIFKTSINKYYIFELSYGNKYLLNFY